MESGECARTLSHGVYQQHDRTLSVGRLERKCHPSTAESRRVPIHRLSTMFQCVRWCKVRRISVYSSGLSRWHSGIWSEYRRSVGPQPPHPGLDWLHPENPFLDAEGELLLNLW